MVLYELRGPLGICVLALVCGIPGVYALMKIWTDILLIIINLMSTIPVISLMVKLFVIWYKKSALLPLMRMMRDDWAYTTDTVERDVMIRRAKVGRQITIGGNTMLLMAIIIGVVLSFLGVNTGQQVNATDPGIPMVISAYYPYDARTSPLFELTYVGQAIALVFGGLAYSTIDFFFGLLVFHACGQSENLRNRIVNIKLFKDFDFVLMSTVRKHVQLIRFIRTIEDTFYLLLLVLLADFCCTFCLCGFLTVYAASSKDDISALRGVFVMAALVNAFAHTCLYCVVGELVANETEGILYAAYETDWVSMSPRSAKSLILIMARAKEPLCIRAGRLFPLTMATFCGSTSQWKVMVVDGDVTKSTTAFNFCVEQSTFRPNCGSSSGLFSLLKMSAGYISFLFTRTSEM